MDKIKTQVEDPTDNLVLVHADGGACHGKPIVNNRCTGCGIAPDMQSTELWPPSEVK